MKREEREVVSLLKEIDTICRKNQIPYYLSPRLTLCGVMEQPFPENPLLGIVLMKTADMEKFYKVMEEQLPSDRGLDSMQTNPWFPGFYLRYTNKNTLCFRIDTGREYQYPGIGINIFPLQSKISSKRARLKNRIEEVGWSLRCESYSDKLSLKELLAKRWIQLRCLGGRKRLGKTIFRNFCKRQQQSDSGKYILKQKKRTITYDRDIFDKRTTITLGGETFQVPFDTKRYLEATYGAGYEKKAEVSYNQNLSLMVSARVGYEQFFAENPDVLKLYKRCKKQHKVQIKKRYWQNYIDQCWEYVKFCGRKKELGLGYVHKKEYIKTLYKNEDYITLEVLFRPYTKMMQTCLDQDEIFVEDEEILEIYLGVLEKTGKLILKKKIEQQWR